MLIERSTDPRWLSNAYVVADQDGGDAMFVDTGAPLEPLLRAVERWGVRPRCVLRTHSHHDHVEHEGEVLGRFGIEVLAGPTQAGGLHVEALETPGHSDDHVTFLINGDIAFTGDILFRDSVGGGNFDVVRRSVLRLAELAPETRVFAGHGEETTIGRERDENPFLRIWRGLEPEGTERCRVGDRDATLVVWSPDYDGNGKAWVRFDDGTDAIVGGSRVERG